MLRSAFLEISCLLLISAVECLDPTSGATGISTAKKSTVSTEDTKTINYERLIPAVVTIGVFLIGVLVISIDYWMQQNASTKNNTEVLNQEPLNSQWLKVLKQSQSTASKLRRASAYPTSFLSRDRKSKLKKYALYDEMLAKYKRSLKIQKMNSLKKTALNLTDEGKGEKDGNMLAPLKRVNSRTRMRDLAMRHRISQEHHNMMDNPSHERYLPRWGTSSTSSTYDGSEGNSRLTVSFGDDNAFREVLNRSVELSQEFSLQLSTDDDTVPLLDKQVQPPKQDPSKQNDNILEDPDIKDALRKLSTNDEIPLIASTRKRPKSMFAGTLNDTSFTDEEAQYIVKMKRRTSWYQGIQGLFGDGKTRTGLVSMEKIDEMIEQHVAMALVSRLPDEVLEFHKVDQGKGEKKKSNMGKIRGSKMFEEVCIYDEENDRDKKKSMRPKSLNIFEKIKRRVGRGNSVDHAIDHSEDEAITDLFAKLMDLPSPRRDSNEFLLSQLCDNTENREGTPKTDKVVKDMLKVVEERMIEHLHERDDLDFNEISALETLLDSVSQFCVQYSEDFEDVESRRQLSFSQANEELSEAEARSSNGSSRQSRNASGQVSFDDRGDKVMSVYDTDLLDDEPVKIPNLTNL